MGRNARASQPRASQPLVKRAKDESYTSNMWKLAAGLIAPLLVSLWMMQKSEDRAPEESTNEGKPVPRSRAFDRVKPQKSPSEMAADLLAEGNVAEAVLKLFEIQRKRPSDGFPLRVLHRGLLASTKKNTSGIFAAVRSAASSNFHDVLRLISLAREDVRREEVRGLRYAYQQLLLPEPAAKLGEAFMLENPDLAAVDRAELLLESRRLMEAENAYTSLLNSEPNSTHIHAQCTRIRSEHQAELERSKVLQDVQAHEQQHSHWALRRPSTFTRVERRSSKELHFMDFYENHTLARKPLILTGVDLYAGWDWDFVQRLCGEVPVFLRAPVHSNTSVSWGGLRVVSGEMRLADWMNQVRRDIPRASDDGFVFDFGLGNPNRGCPKLLEQFKLPRFFTNDIFKQLPALQRRSLDPFSNSPGLFVQPSQSSSALHVDSLDSHFLQILLEGRKRWTFYALEPERQRLLLARKLVFQIKENGPGKPRETLWSELMGPDGKNGTDKLLDVAEAHRVEVILEKGDLLFVPGGVPHQVTQLEPSMAISLNYIDHANLDHAIERLLWLANFTENHARRDTLQGVLQHPPQPKMDPTDMTWKEILGP